MVSPLRLWGSAEPILAATWMQPPTMVTNHISGCERSPRGRGAGSDCSPLMGPTGRPLPAMKPGTAWEDRLPRGRHVSPLRSCSEPVRGLTVQLGSQPPFPPTPTPHHHAASTPSTRPAHRAGTQTASLPSFLSLLSFLRCPRHFSSGLLSGPRGRGYAIQDTVMQTLTSDSPTCAYHAPGTG